MFNEPSATWAVEAESSSESASLQGHKAKTPIIAGAVSGACVGLAWIIGFIIYFYRRHKRDKEARAAGFKSHRDMLDPPKKPEVFVIPPDPAVLQGLMKPGEHVFPDPKHNGGPLHANTIPLAKRDLDHVENVGGDVDIEARPDAHHVISSPAKVTHTSPQTITPSSLPSTNHEPQRIEKEGV